MKANETQFGQIGVIFDGGQASKANQSSSTFDKNHSLGLDWLATIEDDLQSTQTGSH